MNKKYYIFVGNEKIEVDQKIYQNYWQITNRENYLERLDRKSKLLFFSNLSSEYPCEESLVDETCQCRENRGNPDDVTGSERGDF